MQGYPSEILKRNPWMKIAQVHFQPWRTWRGNSLAAFVIWKSGFDYILHKFHKFINNSSSLNKRNQSLGEDFTILFLRFLFSFCYDCEKISNTTRQCLTTFPNTPKLVKNTPLSVAFSTFFSVFGNAVKHGLLCLIYYANFEANKKSVD